MFVFASAHPETLDSWRTALGDRAAAVEIRRTDALSECFTRMQPQLVLLDVPELMTAFSGDPLTSSTIAEAIQPPSNA